MANLVGYELHTYRGGVWKIDSIYDDREIAVFEAQRVIGSGRFSAVRVVEERFDDASGKSTTKTVFRSAKADEDNAEAAERQKTVRREVQEARKAASVGDFKRSANRHAQQAASSGPGAVTLILILGGLVLAGIGAIIGVRYLFGGY